MNHKFLFFRNMQSVFFFTDSIHDPTRNVFRLSALNKEYNDIVCGLWSAREQMQHGNYLLSTKIKMFTH